MRRSRSRRSRRRRVDLDPHGLGSLVEGRKSGSPPTPSRWPRDRPCKHLWCLWDWRIWAEGLGCHGPAARPAAHASARLIRLSGDVTPLGRARSAASSHCSGGSRSAHSRSQRNRGPASRPARPGPAPAAQVSPRESPLRLPHGHRLRARGKWARRAQHRLSCRAAGRFRRAHSVTASFKSLSNSRTSKFLAAWRRLAT